jgi:hypothetical protein
LQTAGWPPTSQIGGTMSVRHSSLSFSDNPEYLDQGYVAVDVTLPAPAVALSHAPLDFPETDAKGGGGPAGGGPGGGGPGGGGSGGVVATYTSGNPSLDDANEFNITIDFSGSWSAPQQAVVEWAADFYSSLITGDIHNDFDLNGNLVDDIVITVSNGRIDGNGNPLSGNTLAQTSNIVVRDAGTEDAWLPLTASIKLDTTDLKSASLSGTWDAIILHEMGHALGFVGGIFSQLGLTDNAGHFTGAQAQAAYGGPVPLEDTGGTGTAGSHWDEATFAPKGQQMSNELMTGYFVPGETTLLSDTTIGALADLGYNVQDPSALASMVVDSHLLIS